MPKGTIINSRLMPDNFGPLRDADGHARLTGPCGDTMEYWILVKDGLIACATYTTDGCRDSVLCGSVAATLALGKKITEAERIGQHEILSAAGDVPEEARHCALLSQKALGLAIRNHQAKVAAKTTCDRTDGDCGKCQKESCGKRKAEDGNELEPSQNEASLSERMARIKHKLVILSGKGGVGKSTVAVNLAVSLAQQGKRVGMLDTDIHGPSIPTMLNLPSACLPPTGQRITPVKIKGFDNLKVISIGMFLETPDSPVIWRGPMKTGVIKQFIQEVEWGDLDYLVIDCPPGTGDEPLSVIQLLDHPDGAIVVTTPQEVAAADVRKSINFCRQLKLPVLGLVENMSGFVCPNCGQRTEIFKAGGGQKISHLFNIPLLGSIPIDPGIGMACDEGTPFVERFADSSVAGKFARITDKILHMVE